MVNDGDKGEGKVFRGMEEAIMAYSDKVVTLQARIKVRRTLEVNGELKSKLVEHTVGGIVFNQPVPQDLGYVDRNDPEAMFGYEVKFQVTKKNLPDLIAAAWRCMAPRPPARCWTASRPRATNFTISGITVAVCDAVIPPQKPELLAEADERVSKVIKATNRGLISNEERYNGVIQIWQETTDKVSKALADNLEDRNPIFMMADSGARGS